MPTDLTGAEFSLSLADRTLLALRAADAEGARIVSFLAQAAQLGCAPEPLPPGTRRLLAVTGGGQDKVVHQVSKAGAGANGDTVCVLEPRGAQMLLQRQREVAHPDRGRGDSPALVLGPITEEQWFWQQLVRLSACVGRETHARGGVLLHSGLATYPGSTALSPSGSTGVVGGILLAGRSGVGKSTAIRRLPSPWDSLADDVTLVVRDEWGMYWAHPWPTWSRFFGEGAGDGSDTWDVQQAVPLWAIFVLEQGEKDRAEPMGPGHAVCLLAELGLQTSTQALIGMPLDEIAAFNLQRFENLCDLVQAVPAYLLDVSLNGTFWEEIERVLELPGVGA